MGTFVNGGERIIVSRSVHQCLLQHTRWTRNGKVGYQLLSNRGACLNLKPTQRHCLHPHGPAHVKFHRLCAFDSLEMMKSSISLGTANWSAIPSKKIDPQNPMDSRTALKEIYERLRPGEPKTAESFTVGSRFFDPRRLAPVGRYKINKKSNIKNRLLNQTIATIGRC